MAREGDTHSVRPSKEKLRNTAIQCCALNSWVKKLEDGKRKKGRSLVLSRKAEDLLSVGEMQVAGVWLLVVHRLVLDVVAYWRQQRVQ